MCHVGAFLGLLFMNPTSGLHVYNFYAFTLFQHLYFLYFCMFRFHVFLYVVNQSFGSKPIYL